MSDTTKNQGGGSTAVSSTTSFYLSTNSTLDTGDVFLGSRGVGVLGPGGSDSHSTTLTIPAQTAAGSYYIIAKADDGSAVSESVETNNTRAKSISVN